MGMARLGMVGPVVQSPCGNCKDRFFDGQHICHSTCEKYKTYKEKLAKANEEIRNEEAVDSVCTELTMKRCCRQTRKKMTER